MKKQKNFENYTSEYFFTLENFNGPLDLLLELIKKKNMDIFEVDLVLICNQYLEIIEELSKKNIDIASEYLVMASELIYLKSRLVLADPDEKEEVEEDKKRLLQLLAEYEEFKKISVSLKEQEKKRKEIYVKKPSDVSSFIKDIDDAYLGPSGNPIKLIVSLRKMFERTYAEKLKTIKIETFNLSPAERKQQIRSLIDNCIGKISFELLFSVPSINHFVITLIAILDMARKEELVLEQEIQFGTITISKGINYDN